MSTFFNVHELSFSFSLSFCAFVNDASEKSMPQTFVRRNDRNAESCPVPVPTSMMDALAGMLRSRSCANEFAAVMRSVFVANRSSS